MFKIYINDFFRCTKGITVQFADDTTLYESGGNLNNLIEQFEKGIEPLIEWFKLNKLDINWSKTFFMIITNKHIKNRLPK